MYFENFAKLTGKHLHWSFFFKKVADCGFIKDKISFLSKIFFG